ncbi:hypothetical protein MMC31_008080, partial [Peltigera leucophlebia]|nr:hypothetical protein [Peltigera leucophlebia]
VEKQPDINTTTIYTDNQAAIRKIKDPNNKSGQHLARNIVTMIDGLRSRVLELKSSYTGFRP